MIQKGKYEQFSSKVVDIGEGWGGYGRERGWETRSPHRWEREFTEWVGKETFLLIRCIVVWFVKFFMSFVMFHKVSLIICYLRLRINGTPSLPFTVT